MPVILSITPFKLHLFSILITTPA